MVSLSNHEPAFPGSRRQFKWFAVIPAKAGTQKNHITQPILSIPFILFIPVNLIFASNARRKP